MSTVNLGKGYNIVCGGKVAASFRYLKDARKALETVFSPNIGAYIQYPDEACRKHKAQPKKRRAQW